MREESTVFGVNFHTIKSFFAPHEEHVGHTCAFMNNTQTQPS
jgi:hypothetical protein